MGSAGHLGPEMTWDDNDSRQAFTREGPTWESGCEKRPWERGRGTVPEVTAGRELCARM